jgi:hypothetical protein
MGTIHMLCSPLRLSDAEVMGLLLSLARHVFAVMWSTALIPAAAHDLYTRCIAPLLALGLLGQW